MSRVLYVYAVGKTFDLDRLADIEAVDGSRAFRLVGDDLVAVVTDVDGARFSQEEIDRHAGDLQWLGNVGLSHQRVNERLNEQGAIPLRAFTLFSGDDALRAFLDRNRGTLHDALHEIGGRSEFTLQLTFDHERWSRALSHRAPTLRGIEEEAGNASPGRAYLLRKKLEDGRRDAAREAEAALLEEIRERLARELPESRVVIDARERRGGSDPQINILLARYDARFSALVEALEGEYRNDGVGLRVTGPWPPYSFVSGEFA